MLPWFFRWLLACSLRSIILLIVGQHAPLYRYIWGYTEPILLVLFAAACVEAHMRSAAFSRDARALPAIALGVIAILAAAVTVATMGLDGFDLDAMNWRRCSFLLERLVSTACWVFLLGSALFYSEAGVPLSRSLRTHRNLATVYAAASAAGFLIMHVTRGEWKQQSVLALMCASIIIMLRWSMIGPVDLQLPAFSDEAKRYLRRELQSGEDIFKRIVVQRRTEELVQRRVR